MAITEGDHVSMIKLADIYIDRFVPMITCTQEVQKPNHIIYDWTRGGDPSRQLVKNKEYLENCGYKKSF